MVNGPTLEPIQWVGKEPIHLYYYHGQNVRITLLSYSITSISWILLQTVYAIHKSLINDTNYDDDDDYTDCIDLSTGPFSDSSVSIDIPTFPQTCVHHYSDIHYCEDTYKKVTCLRISSWWPRHDRQLFVYSVSRMWGPRWRDFPFQFSRVR